MISPFNMHAQVAYILYIRKVSRSVVNIGWFSIIEEIHIVEFFLNILTSPFLLYIDIREGVFNQIIQRYYRSMIDFILFTFYRNNSENRWQYLLKIYNYKYF